MNKIEDYYLPNLLYKKPPEVDLPKWLPGLLVGLVLGIFLISLVSPGFLLLLVLIAPVLYYIHYRSKSRLGNYVNVLRALPRLHASAGRLMKVVPDGIIDPAAIKAARKRIGVVNKRIAVLDSERLAVSEFADAAFYVMELVKSLFLLEVLAFLSVRDQLKAIEADVLTLYHFIGRVDLALSVASLRASLPHYALPDLTGAPKTLVTEGLYHPLVEGCVANELSLNRRGLLLTGSNMSGKSTFVRAVSLNAITAQALNTVFARHWVSPPLAVMTSIRITDDLAGGSSYYMAEIDAIGRLMAAAAADNGVARLFVIDEVFKGTNTVERVAAAKAILEYLGGVGEHLVLVSTHDIELTRLLDDAYALHHFQERLADRALSFDYVLRPGPLTKRNAIGLLEISGYPAQVVAEARRVAELLTLEKTYQ